MPIENISPLIFGFLLFAAFAAGFIDSIAGGGGLVSLPAALLAGLPPHAAMGTTKLMSTLGTTVSLWLYAKSKMMDWGIAAKGMGFSLAGSVVGTLLALAVAPDTLGKIILFLLPVAAAICFYPHKNRKKATAPKNSGGVGLVLTGLVCGLIGMYDGFFGPGTGTFLILGLHFVLGLDLVRASGTAKTFNLASNSASMVTMACNGQVIYALALPMALANIGGNIIGSRLALSKGAGVVRKVLYVSLTLLFLTLLHRYW